MRPLANDGTIRRRSDVEVAVPVQIDVEECLGCGACVPTCPHEALTMGESEINAKLDAERCEDCLDCIEICPVEAILEEGAERPTPRPASPPPPREPADSPPRWQGGPTNPGGPAPACGCDGEPFSLASWRPGKGELRRRIRSRLRGRG